MEDNRAQEVVKAKHVLMSWGLTENTFCVQNREWLVAFVKCFLSMHESGDGQDSQNGKSSSILQNIPQNNPCQKHSHRSKHNITQGNPSSSCFSMRLISVGLWFDLILEILDNWTCAENCNKGKKDTKCQPVAKAFYDVACNSAALVLCKCIGSCFPT
jgi:hypothetical protein